MIWLLAGVVLADEPPVEIHGDVKSFFIAADPPEWVVIREEDLALLELQGLTEDQVLGLAGVSDAPYTQGTAVGRLKFTADISKGVRIEVHEVLGIFGTGPGLGLAGANTGAVLTAPELFPLTWRPDTGTQMGVQLRTDRLVITGKVPGLDVAFGRQPVTFGSGFVFTPLDLVNPFTPSTIDQEYKPGVDALRVDGYIGMSGQVTAVAAWAGDGPVVGADADEDIALDDTIFAVNGRGTVGVTDLVGFVGLVRSEPVLGTSVITSVGPVGLRGDATLTFSEEDDLFVRAVLGMDWASAAGTTLTVETYVQTLGASDPSGYWDMATSDRFATGELWQMGRYYAAVAAGHTITPLITGNLAVVANLADPSALVAPNLSWSVSENATVGLGGFIGLGKRPSIVALPLTEELDPAVLGESLNSEFGLTPPVFFAQMATYF